MKLQINETLRDGKFAGTKAMKLDGNWVQISIGQYGTPATEKIFNNLAPNQEIEVKEYTNKEGYLTYYLVDPDKKPMSAKSGLNDELTNQIYQDVKKLTEMSKAIWEELKKINKSEQEKSIEENFNAKEQSGHFEEPPTPEEENDDLPF